MKKIISIPAAILMIMPSITGCDEKVNTEQLLKQEQAKEAALQQQESEQLNAFFEKSFQGDVDSSPEFQTYLGLRTGYDQWDEKTEEKSAADQARALNDLNILKTEFDYQHLGGKDRLSYDLFQKRLEERIESYKWRHHNYPISQMFGWQAAMPAFLINFHQISTLTDAESYVMRLERFEQAVRQRLADLKQRQEKGILPPKFVFAHAIDDARNILKGAPFTTGDDSSLLADFKKKLAAIEGDEARKAALTVRAEQALMTRVKPAYEALIALLKQQQAVATDVAGVWKLPNGDAYYAHRLRQITTTNMTAAEVHYLGLEEVLRIHTEMRRLLRQLKFDGTLEDFFDHMRGDTSLSYPNTEEGRTAYLEQVRVLVAKMTARLDDVFLARPKAGLEVKRVEAFREKSTAKAFYSSPALDGSRPGIFYANLYNMAEMPTYEMEALVYHEAIPGHHMQIAIAQELENIPTFRKFGGYTAYIEGWGLYGEYLAKEMGFYEDFYSDFGRLSLELWRACRLVVDTGIHYKKWTREQAIEYLMATTPNQKRDVVRAVERYIVMPGQATAYKIGMIKIQKLRARAESALGEQFDIRQFHDVILRNGAVPLSVLDDNVDRWLAQIR